MSDKLNKNILATIIYYDGLNYPLTVFEIWKYLIRTDYYIANSETSEVTLALISRHLQSAGISSYVEHYSGFYFLKGRKELVGKRIANNKISTNKIKKLRKIAKWLTLMPFIRMIGITGALAMKNAKAQSDWDLLIVLKYGKIWTGRTLLTGFLHLLKKRRHGKNIADRVCLNFFVTDQSLEVITKDLFSASEYMFLFPLYGFPLYNRFQIKNQWIKNMKPSYALGEIEPFLVISDFAVFKYFRKIGEFLFSPVWIENSLKRLEAKRIRLNPKTHQEGSLVYANDDALIFLPSPHGPQVFEKFKEKIQQLVA